MLVGTSQNPRQADDGRLHYLDGLRGWAALAVVIFHSTWELFGAYTPRIRIRALSLATDGDLAVGISSSCRAWCSANLTCAASIRRASPKWEWPAISD